MEETIQDLINSYRTAEAFWEAADGVMDDSVKQYFFVLILSQRNNVAQLVDRIDDIREAAESGNPFMQYAYARYLDTFEPTPDSDRIKERYYNLAIDAGIADAHTFLAMAYRDGDFGEADIARYHSEMDKAMDMEVFSTEQRFMTHAVGEKNVNWWPDNFVRSFKRSCTWPWPLNHFLAPRFDPDTRILCFHGDPSPEEAIAGYRGRPLNTWTRPAPWVKDLMERYA